MSIKSNRITFHRHCKLKITQTGVPFARGPLRPACPPATRLHRQAGILSLALVQDPSRGILSECEGPLAKALQPAIFCVVIVSKFK